VVTRMGEMEGARTDVFGLVQDAEFLPKGRFAVLDSRFGELRILDSEGALLQTIGRPGRGPGEFFVPQALATLGDTLLLLDRGNARLNLYSEHEGDSIALVRSISLSFQAWDVCSTGRRLFLSSDRWETPIVEIEPADGAVLNRFGQAAPGVVLPAAHPQLQQNLMYKYRRGTIACMDSGEGILWASSIGNSLKHYDLRGSRMGETVLQGLEPIQPQLTDRGTVRYGPREGLNYSDGIIDVVAGSGRYIVQARRVDYGERTRRVLTFSYSARDSTVSSVAGTLPVLHAIRNGQLLMSVRDPFPQLVVAEWR